MSVKIRPYRNGGWEVDILFRLPNGRRYRERCKAPARSRSGALRWGQDRERHLLLHGPEQSNKEVPTLEQFASRFIEGHAVANRQKPSGIASKKSILNVHLVPILGSRRLSEIGNEDVQRLKRQLASKSPKTVNNVLTVLNVMLKQAVEWRIMETVPCSIKLLTVTRSEASFFEFDDYQRLVEAALSIDKRTHLIVLLGGDAGLRVGEIVALQWPDVDFDRGHICVRHSDWRGQLTTPKNGRVRFVTMTNRLAAALRQHRHLRNRRVLCKDDGSPLTRQGAWSRVRYAARRAKLRTGVHILRHTFCSHLVMRGAVMSAVQELVGHRDLTMTQRYSHLSRTALADTIRLLEKRAESPKNGDILETKEPASAT
jgi:integrase